MYFFGVQASVTDQFSLEQQNWDLVAVAMFRSGLLIDIDHIDDNPMRCRQLGQFGEHLLA
jgi:hypothetical protein